MNIFDIFVSVYFMAAQWKTLSVEYDEFPVVGSFFLAVVQIANFLKGRTLVYVIGIHVNHCQQYHNEMRGYWYLGIFTHIARIQRDLCACNCKHTYYYVHFFLVSISMGCFILPLLILLLFTHHFPATFHSSVFLSSTTCS